MLCIQWEEICVAKSLLIYCMVYHVGTEGVCNQKPRFLKMFVLTVGGGEFAHLCGLYQASRHQCFAEIFTLYVCFGQGHFMLSLQPMEEITDSQPYERF